MDTTALIIYVCGGVAAVIVVVVIIVCCCWYKRCRHDKGKSQKRVEDKYMQTIEEWLGTGIQVDVGTSVATPAKDKSEELLLESIEDESNVKSQHSEESFKQQSGIPKGSKEGSELSQHLSTGNKSQSDYPAERSATGMEEGDENIREEPDGKSMLSHTWEEAQSKDTEGMMGKQSSTSSKPTLQSSKTSHPLWPIKPKSPFIGRGRKRAVRPDAWLPARNTMRTSHNTSTR